MDRTQLVRKYPADQFMPVLISEVTRMSKGNYCVAGWDIHRERMVRPLQSTGANWTLGTARSVFSVGHLVNCVPSGIRNSAYPHATEDLRLSTSPALLETLDEPAIYALLLPTCFRSIPEIFGLSLTDDRYIIENTQCRSLGGLRIPRKRVRFIRDGYERLRLELTEVDNTVYRLAVTCDTLMHVFSPGDEDAEPHFGVSDANDWLEVNPPETEIILRIGLARAWDGRNGDWNPRRCYAQLNGIICPTNNDYIFADPPSS